jgi:aryl-alcohol dehydrogenase-like predicted oxidoreductase
MEHLVQSGKVLYIGSSNFAGWQIAHAQGEARARHFMGLVSEQSLYNLRARTVELEVLPACRSLGIGVLPWSPLSRGVLAGESEGQVRRSREIAAKAVREDQAKLQAYAALCRDLGQSAANVALAWLLGNPAVTAPIIGPRTVEQLSESLRAPAIRLEAETLARLDTIWPGPGGEAPEAYAW